jgi:hypothetical protein
MLISSRRSFVLVVREGTEVKASGGLRLSGSTAGLIVVAAKRCPAGDAPRVQAARRSYRWWRPPDAAPIVSEQHQDEHEPVGHGWDHEEIGRKNGLFSRDRQPFS